MTILSALKKHQITALLPAYVNGTLSPAQAAQVEQAVARFPDLADELQHCRRVARLSASQPMPRPSAEAWQKTLAAARTVERAVTPPAPLALEWRWRPSAALLSLAVLILLWLALRPGVVLQWTVNSDGLTAYRLYRAPLGSSEYALVGEMPVQAGIFQYQYTDAWLLPGQTYSYVVEGVKDGSRSFVSQAVTAAGGQALPGQVALVLISVVIGYGLYLLTQNPAVWMARRPGRV